MRVPFATIALALFVLMPGRVQAQISDADLAERVAAAVRGYAQFSIFDDIEIEVVNRVAKLTGRVTAPLKKTDIAARAARVDGVDRVIDDIEVLPVSQHDSNLRVRIARAIYTNSTFWHYASMANPPIHIVVERGRVTLTGFVNSEVERMMAYALAQVDGAFSVTNRLRLDPR